MSRLTLLALTGVFLVSAVAVSLISGAEANTGIDRSVERIETGEVVRCSLQPNFVAHPDTGARIVILERTC